MEVLIAASALLVGTLLLFLYQNYAANKKLDTVNSRLARLEVENRSLERTVLESSTKAGQQAYHEELSRRDDITQVGHALSSVKSDYASKSLLARTFKRTSTRISELEIRVEAVETAQLKVLGRPVPKPRAESGVYDSTTPIEERDTIPPPVNYNRFRKKGS